MSESAFVRVFKAEMDAAQHSALVELYAWANSTHYGYDPDLQERAEEWAREIEDAGLAREVLAATAEKPCPECGR